MQVMIPRGGAVATIDLKIVVAIGILFCIPLLVYSYVLTQSMRRPDYIVPFCAAKLGDIIITSRSIIVCYYLIRRCLVGACDPSDVFKAFCNPVHELHELPVFPVLFVVISPFVWCLLFRCHSFWTPFLVNLVGFCSLVAASIIVQAPTANYPTLVVLYAAVALGLYNLEYSAAYSFSVVINLERAIKQKMAAVTEKDIIASSAEDLRHFVGNVAHDLKTPIQALVSELDYMEGGSQTTINSRLQSVHSMKNICNFMTMTINRYD